jgi:hypothetical protein
MRRGSQPIELPLMTLSKVEREEKERKKNPSFQRLESIIWASKTWVFQVGFEKTEGRNRWEAKFWFLWA